MRILPFLFLLALTAPAGAEAPWTFDEWSDDITDEKRALAASWTSDRKSIGVVCFGSSPDRLEVKAGFAAYLDSEFERVRVTMRIDKQAPVTMSWWAVKGNYAYTSDDAVRVARMLLSGERLVIRATDYEFASHTHKFSLEGAAPLIRRVLSACGA